MKNRYFIALILITAMFASCGKVPETSDATTVASETTTAATTTTEETTEATTEETTEVITATSVSESAVTDATAAAVISDNDPFESNASLYNALEESDLPAFGNLTDEEYIYFSGIYCNSSTNCFMSQQDGGANDPFGAHCGFLTSNFEGAQNAYMRHVVPYPVNPSASTSSSLDISYVPVTRVNAELQNVLGINMDGLSNNPFTVVTHDGVNCVAYSSGTGASPNICFTLVGGNRINNDYYLCFEGSAGDNLAGISIAHFVLNDDGSYTLVGCRYTDRWTSGSHRVISAVEEISAEDIATDVLSSSYEVNGVTHYYTWGTDLEQASASDAFALELIRDTYYAHHGCIFEDPYIQTYFESRAWYTGSIPEAQFEPLDLNAVEDQNVANVESLMQ